MSRLTSIASRLQSCRNKRGQAKDNDKLLKKPIFLLADELTAINQYIVHSEVCANWGYDKLHEYIEKRAIDEMKHAEKLIVRILFLEGVPVVSELKTIHIGDDVPTSTSPLPLHLPTKHVKYGDAE